MIIWVRERFKWMGQHSGYDEICKAIATVRPGHYASAWREPDRAKSKLSKRLLNYLAKNAEASTFYNHDSAAAELSALWQCFLSRHKLVHITYVESSLGIVPKFNQSRAFKLVGTAHQPMSWWRLMHPYPRSIKALDALIVPGSREVNYFEHFLPKRVYFIPHGVDTDFFHPIASSHQTQNIPRCVFSGTWLRDLNTLVQVVEQVLAHDPSIQFDMIVPRSKRNEPAFYRIARHDQVFWHTGISDEQLRAIYQQASCILLPFLDCTANNALLEAMACGVPIISNRVGGTSDYTRPSFACLHSTGDVDGFTESVLSLTGNHLDRQRMGAEARLFAKKNFTWNQIAVKTLEVYDKVLSEI